MGSDARLDDARFVDGIARWLAHHHGVTDVVVDELSQPSEGFSSATTLLRARWTSDRPVVEHLVVRMAPDLPGTFPDYDLVVQHAAQRAAATAGVPIAEPLVTETDSSWLGAPFTVMPRVDGHIVGQATPIDPWIGSLSVTEQAELHDAFLATLGAVHAAATEPAIAGDVPVRDDRAELDRWDEYLRWSSNGVPVPALVEALEWCRAHQPAPPVTTAPVLCWGDVRLGNVVFGDDLRPLAVLDWDMAVIGRPEHDVAWFTTLEGTVTTLSGLRVEGFPDRDGTIARYQDLTGRALQDIEWYETLAMLRSTAIMTRISFLSIAAGRKPLMAVDDNPLLDLLHDRIRRT